MTQNPSSEVRLQYYGGLLGAFAPFLLFLLGVAWLGLNGAPGEKGFWPILIGALALGMMLARDRKAYADATIGGMSQPIVMIMIMAWLLAGMLAALMQASGFVDALVWLAGTRGVAGGAFVAACFLICSLVSTATGTSLGTIVLCGPLLYPAGGPLQADPVILLGAILGGATFGDNISPVSDTTIASASTQNADMGGVVRSRLRYALPAGLIALIAYTLLGGLGGEGATTITLAGRDPAGLPMLAVPVLVIGLLLARRHLLEGLFAGIAAAAVLGLVLNRWSWGDLMAIQPEQYTATGILLQGMERGIGISIFTLLIMGLTGGLTATGLLDDLIKYTEARTKNVRSAESWIFIAVSAAVLVTTHAVVAILTIGPLATKAGKDYGIGAYRRANLLDTTVCTYPFLLPYFIPTILAASITRDHGVAAMPVLTAWDAGIANIYSWLLLVVVILAIITGYGRQSSLDAGPVSGPTAGRELDQFS